MLTTFLIVAAFGYVAGLAVGRHMYRPRLICEPPAVRPRGPLARGQMSPPRVPPIPTSDRRPTSEPPVEPHRTVTLRVVAADGPPIIHRPEDRP